jgi:hypothetical protein
MPTQAGFFLQRTDRNLLQTLSQSLVRRARVLPVAHKRRQQRTDILGLLPPAFGFLPQIFKVQVQCEACHGVLQQFRNNVVFHSRSLLAAHVKARRALTEEDTFLDLESARMDFQRLMAELIADELNAIPELPKILTELGLSHHPAFANLFSAAK